LRLKSKKKSKKNIKKHFKIGIELHVIVANGIIVKKLIPNAPMIFDFI
jgi:hypothetical protein